MASFRNNVSVVAAAAALMAGTPAWAQVPAPPPPGSVTIHRDEWGVPHILASRPADAFYGLGYAQGQDQLHHILAFFLAARGELSGALRESSGTELPPFLRDQVGSPATIDQQSQLWRHAQEGRVGWERLSTELRENYRHYVMGLTRFMDDHPGRTPAWAPRLQPWDPVILSRWILWSGYQAGQGMADCARGGVRLSASMETQLRRRSARASNEWILAPWRTADDVMMVLSDPHGGIDGSFVYESRIHAGDLRVAGFAIGPLLLLTHNAHVSVGMTTGAPDVADCYEVEVDSADSLRFRFDGEWRSMETHEVEFWEGGSKKTRTVAYTRHNGVMSPVVAREGNRAWAISTAYMHTAGDFDEEVYRINLAESVGEVQNAMERLGMFPQNLMFGDRHGDSWYVRAGRTPVRPEGFEWDRPVPGNTSESAWLGIHPLESLVQLASPDAGYMQNNNVSPDRMLEDSPLTADRYPSYIFNDRPGRTNTRGIRAVEVLSSASAFTVDDAIQLALDEKWVGAETWILALRRAMARSPATVAGWPAPARRLAGRLVTFDGHARQESEAAMAFHAWREAVFGVASEAGDMVREALTDPIWEKALPPPEADGPLLDAVERAAATLVERYGSTMVRLGDVFRIGRGGHSFPLGGASIVPPDRGDQAVACALGTSCPFTLRAMTFNPPDSLGHRYVYLGSRLLRLVVFTNPLQSFTLHNYGQSQDPTSPHYVDQARLSSRRRLKPTYFNLDELSRHVVSTTTLDVRPE